MSKPRKTKTVREIEALIRSVHKRFKLEYCSKHLRAVIVGPKGQASVVCSKTPSDFREQRNMRACLIRAVQQVGLEQSCG